MSTYCRASAPRIWGCPEIRQQHIPVTGVRPTHVGVLQASLSACSLNVHPPHARGGAPIWSDKDFRALPSAPRTWGCSEHATQELAAAETHPHACEGRSPGRARGRENRGPRTWRCSHGLRFGRYAAKFAHSRGGAFGELERLPLERASAPCVRGCPGAAAGLRCYGPVLSTGVGVLRSRRSRDSLCCTPPPSPVVKGSDIVSAPRTWGCPVALLEQSGRDDVRPTHVGVPRRSRDRHEARYRPPHARGGAPVDGLPTGDIEMSSPRMWGCPARPDAEWAVLHVRPTHVGVPRTRTRWRPWTLSPPHARGGAPGNQPPKPRRVMSAPHTWGCPGQ